jgi:hypothetical protein
MPGWNRSTVPCLMLKEDGSTGAAKPANHYSNGAGGVGRSFPVSAYRVGWHDAIACNGRLIRLNLPCPEQGRLWVFRRA